jgi:hypothetical protein
MKKFYLSFSTLVCMTFLFALNSCTTDSDFVSDDILEKVNANQENLNYNSRKEDVLPANSLDSTTSTGLTHDEFFEVDYELNSFPESIPTYSTVEADKVIDPDWKKLITHFIEGNVVTE